MVRAAEWRLKFGPGSLPSARWPLSYLKSLLILGFLFSAQASAETLCREDVVDLKWQGGSARFTVELADTIKERSRGLMHREELARFAGMLFVYPRPQSVAFWMENTLISLDMIFLTKDGVVARIHENAEPLSRTSIPGGNNILAVLEVNGGLSEKLGIKVGAEMRHPAFDTETAAWPCS